MTSPDGASPEGALGVGLFAARQAQTEDEARRAATNGAWQGSWNSAQDAHQKSTAGMFREVTRLDNRIDTFLYGNDLVSLATFSESAWWDKPPGAKTVIVNPLGGSSGGGVQNGEGSGEFRGGKGGFSGGWDRITIAASDLPDQVWVEVGAGSEGATSPGAAAPAGGSAFGDYSIAEGATGTNYGSGNFSFRVRGGDGGYGTGSRLWGVTARPAAPGGEGSFHPGGEAGAPTGSGNDGVNGYSVTRVGDIGMGSGGGGGAINMGVSGTGGDGGDGGWPSGPGGGAGAYNLGGPGRGGNGATGAVFVMTILEDALGLPPTPPTNLSVVSVTATSATISWTASTDDIAVRRYEVFVDGVSYQSVDDIQVEITGLQSATTYSVTVQAVDLGGNRSEMSAPLSVITIV
ncbi:fibronectin type III domain-containing protein [Rhodococcus rhodochrous]|uniref:fibronectin type III domain-containing protein n=1 Tax=Rhodococcus rhodochrous TaxID=1829 RepID=UPI001E3F44B6|nr:fibronectin type III domain-containing protein [Rhodococcus rhodochrous]MCD2096521.1 fibronectin type III domain-containing protein [Rhodococcus rhodochrous]MCD2121261.1 fibronectin type III domain-containing protein [Rhodococcus rhodochrous]MCQ4137355.1 fibronectin type III domain-containing protein [Rhodococcus rhodochrous]MDJ0021152.1 fibronectin type III domain-containing protein [Rhodococcus rhodochrous]